MPLLQAFEATDEYVTLKFDATVKLTSITLDKFSLFIAAATPPEVTDPFRPIVLIDDYDTISRLLRLYYNNPLEASTTYTFYADGLIDVAGLDLPSASYSFTTGTSPAPTLPAIPVEPPVVIEDHSIRSDAFTAEVIFAANPDFYITETDPEINELMVDPGRNAGRVTVKFSVRPAAHFANAAYFKAQKKTIQRAPTRWLTIDAQYSLDSTRPWVYVDFPSNDATPVYGVAGQTYFEPGTKYRIRISKDVGI